MFTSILALVFMVELSGAGGYSQYYFPTTTQEEIPLSIYTTFYAELQIIDYIRIKGAIKTLEYKHAEGLSFIPYGLSSFFEAFIIYNGVSFGYRHSCTHPVIPYYDFNMANFLDQAGSEIFLRYESPKITIIK